MKKGVYVLIGLVIILGAIVPFAAQFILPFFFETPRIQGAEVWNQYISINNVFCKVVLIMTQIDEIVIVQYNIVPAH